jgi:hypothetical protein
MFKKIQNSKIFNSIYISASTLPQPPFCIAGQSYKTFLVHNLIFGEKKLARSNLGNDASVLF